MTPPFSGAVLTGGRSRRMGTDKALLAGPGGRPLALIARDALVAAGATEVLAVGGDLPALAALGLAPVADAHPGEGPLGGLVTALGAASCDRVVVLSCDLPLVDAHAVRAVVAGLDDEAADAAVPLVGGRPQPLLAAYRCRALPALAAAFAEGGRALHAAVAALVVVHPPLADPAVASDADDPEALAALGRARPRPLRSPVPPAGRPRGTPPG